MANLNLSYQKYCDKIRLTKSKKDNLVTSRNANRERIKDHFKDILKEKSPDFFQQGSFSLKTTINPIDGEYDVDDGVYLQNLEDNFLTDLKPETAQGWIVDAVKDATKAKVICKPSCVRLTYANDYHLDMPVYGVKDNITYLAHSKSGNWIENDPKGFNEWFYAKLNSTSEQLRRNIIYLKAWADFNSLTNITGILITVLVCNNHSTIDDRDDESLSVTLGLIINTLIIKRSLNMPVAPYDNLLEKYNSKEIDSIITSLSELKTAIDKALAEADTEKASEFLIACFGDRFVNEEIKDKTIKNYALPIMSVKPKPWC